MKMLTTKRRNADWIVEEISVSRPWRVCVVVVCPGVSRVHWFVIGVGLVGTALVCSGHEGLDLLTATQLGFGTMMFCSGVSCRQFILI